MGVYLVSELNPMIITRNRKSFNNNYLSITGCLHPPHSVLAARCYAYGIRYEKFPPGMVHLASLNKAILIHPIVITSTRYQRIICQIALITSCTTHQLVENQLSYALIES